MTEINGLTVGKKYHVVYNTGIKRNYEMIAEFAGDGRDCLVFSLRPKAGSAYIRIEWIIGTPKLSTEDIMLPRNVRRVK